MKSIYPSVCRESYDRQHARGRYNPAQVAIVPFCRGKFLLELPSGTTDDNFFWQEGREISLLSINYRYDYCGVTVFSLIAPARKDSINPKYNETETVWEMFLQTDGELNEILGPKGLKLAERTIRDRILAYRQ